MLSLPLPAPSETEFRFASGVGFVLWLFTHALNEIWTPTEEEKSKF